jgi:hypothetical protein
MITGNYELGARQRPEKLRRGLELCAAGALCEIARHHDEVRHRLDNGPQQGPWERWLDTTKVQVEEMNDGAHGFGPSH